MPCAIGRLGTGVIVAVAVLAASAGAQEPKAAAKRQVSLDLSPSITRVFPPGATIGTETEWTLSGKHLDQVERWLTSGSGVEIATKESKGPGSLIVRAKVAADAEPGYRELRGVGSGGISNLVLFHIDCLPQTVEAEPNDEPAKANPVGIGSSVAGVLKARDIDCFRIKGRAGQKVVIDFEAQRLGTPVSPVVTVMTASGTPLKQGREQPGVNRDCRLVFRFPRDGAYVIQVRDNTYSGADAASYRLRLDAAPFATGLFPLGGPKGQTITVTASGGNLAEPRTKSVTLPDAPGTILDPGSFDGPDGPVLAPAKLIVGDGPEINELPPGPDGTSTTPLPLNAIANGRIGRPGEVDRYVVPGKKGQKIHIRVHAAALGSWLDSVVTIRDDKGNLLAENDDPPTNNQQRGPFNLGVADTAPDSRFFHEVKADGDLTIDVTDRYSAGGPEYAYRLEVGAARPDYTISLLLVNPAANRRGAVARTANVRLPPGAIGAFNLKPGARQPVNFLITPDGFAGPIEVHAEGLPPGVKCDPVTIRVAGSNRGNPQPVGGALVLGVAEDAEAAIGDLRVVATAQPKDAPALTRTASAVYAFPALVENNTPFGGPRPTTHDLASLPIAVLGSKKDAKTAKPTIVQLKNIPKPGPLLMGGTIELAIELDPPLPDINTYQLDADLQAKGLLAQIIVPDPDAVDLDDDEAPVGPVVRVMAAVNAKPGPKTMVVTFAPKGGETIMRKVVVDVMAPAALSVPQAPIVLTPGAATPLHVACQRNAGFDGPIELKLEGLPPGVKALGPKQMESGQETIDVPLQMDAGARPLDQAVAFRVTGLVRMPRGQVRIEPPNRPRVVSR
jgi:hypothetical protein